MSGAQKGGILAKKNTPAPARQAGGGGLGSLFKFYTDDTPGIKVGPTTVLVLSLIFMASVVVLHIVNKVRVITLGGSSTDGSQEL